MRGETPIGQETGTKTLVRKMSNRNGPGQGGGGYPGSAGAGGGCTFPASPPSRGARRGSWSCEGGTDAHGKSRSRCSQANSTNEEVTETTLKNAFRVTCVDFA